MPNHPEYSEIPLKELLCLYDLDQTYDLVLPQKIGWWAGYSSQAYFFFSPYVGSDMSFYGILIDYFTPDDTPFADQLSNILYDWYLPWTGTDNYDKTRNYQTEPGISNGRVSFQWLEDLINPTIDWDNAVALTITLPTGSGTGTIAYYIDELYSHWDLPRIRYAASCLNKRIIHYQLSEQAQTIKIPIGSLGENIDASGLGQPIIGTFVVAGAEAEVIKTSIPSFWLYENLPTLLDSITQTVLTKIPYIFQWQSGYRTKSEARGKFETSSTTETGTFPNPELGGNWNVEASTSTLSINSWYLKIAGKYPDIYEIYTIARPEWYRFCWLKTANNRKGELVERQDRQSGDYCYYWRWGYLFSDAEYIYKGSNVFLSDPSEILFVDRAYIFEDNYLNNDYEEEKWVIVEGRHRIKYDNYPTTAINPFTVGQSMGLSGLYQIMPTQDLPNIPSAGFGLQNYFGTGKRSPSFQGMKARVHFVSRTKNIRHDWSVYSTEFTFTVCEMDINDNLNQPTIIFEQTVTLPPEPRSNSVQNLYHYIFDDTVTFAQPTSIFYDISDSITVTTWDEFLQYQDLTIMVDSQRIKEIHAALQADKFAWMPNTTDTLRNANIGYLVERIARVLGVSVNPDGSLRTIRPKKFIKAGEIIPAGWYGGCFGLNNGGSVTGQQGGTPEEERDGIVYEIKCNNYDPDAGTIEAGGYALCENWIQYLDAMQDDLDKALGWQELGAVALPSADSSRQVVYEGLITTLVEALFNTSALSMNTTQTQATALATHQMVREALRGLGLPLQEKIIPVDIGDSDSDGFISYPGYDPKTPTLSTLLLAILQNQGLILGSNVKIPDPPPQPQEN